MPGELRHAYIVLAHRAPDQLARLVDRLDGPGVEFLIHVDRRSPPDVHRRARDRLAGRANVDLLPSRPTPWAGPWLLRATLAALEVVARRDPDYVSLLTGHDYPLKPSRAIRRTLEQAAGASFIAHFPLPRRAGATHRGAVDPSGWDQGGLPRIEAWSFQVRGREVRIPSRYLQLPIRRHPPAGVRFYGGAAYWTLSRTAVSEVMRVTRERPDVIRFFRRVSLPDELFFQTVLAEAPRAGPLVNDDLRYIDWSAGGQHPKTLRVDDLARLASTSALFARKFDADVDSEVLDRIDHDLLRP